MKRLTFRQVLKTVNNYIVFFLVVGFAVSCCMLLFLNVLADSMGLVFNAENIAVAAKLTFGNVVLITLIFGTIDYIRRKIMVDIPVKRIIEAAETIMQGDFSARVAPIHGAGMEGFNQIGTTINKMAQELSGVETLRTDFIANVSHEMKTPLAVIRNYGKLLQQPALDDQTRMEYGKAVSDSARRLASMMTNILKLNRLENQKIFSQGEEYDLTEQLCGCLLQFEDVWEASDIQIETDLEENVKVKADAELLSLVWNNLLSNAFKFTPAGGTVSVSLHTNEQNAIIRVQDTGCGIPPDVGAHMFEKFYQGDTSHATQGNGLGLALVKRVIDIMQGQISVESAVGKGSAFTVTIRRA